MVAFLGFAITALIWIGYTAYEVYRNQFEPIEVVFPPKSYARQMWEKIPVHDMWYEDFEQQLAWAMKPADIGEAFQFMLGREIGNARVMRKRYLAGGRQKWW